MSVIMIRFEDRFTPAPSHRSTQNSGHPRPVFCSLSIRSFVKQARIIIHLYIHPFGDYSISLHSTTDKPMFTAIKLSKHDEHKNIGSTKIAYGRFRKPCMPTGSIGVIQHDEIIRISAYPQQWLTRARIRMTTTTQNLLQKTCLNLRSYRGIGVAVMLIVTSLLAIRVTGAQTPPITANSGAQTAAPTAAPNRNVATPPTTASASADNPPPETKTLEVNNAAKVALVEGNVVVIAPAAANTTAQRRNVKVGDMLVEGESIVTGRDGELHLDMEDGGYMAIRPNTQMRIIKYQAKGNDSDTGVFGLLQGSFRSITGWIGKFNQRKYTVRTPSATIGIRGTDHEPLVIPAGSTEGEPGTYDKVNTGGSVITTSQGRTEVSPNQAGFVAHGGKTAPRILSDVPDFFRATRNERLLDGKHDTVQQRIAERRDVRRAEIKKNIDAKKSLMGERAADKAAKQEARKKNKVDSAVAKQKAKLDADTQKAKKDSDSTQVVRSHLVPHKK